MALETTLYDVIIVGGGTAGCVIASRLSEDSSLSVLLLEAGPDNTADPRINTPLRIREVFGHPDYDWGYRSVPQSQADNRVFEQTRGRMLGGSSAINSHSLVYPNRAMHDAWAEIAGDEAWSWENMQRYYQRFQTVQAQNESHKVLNPLETNGPIQASYPRKLSKLQTAWEEAFKELGAFHSRSGIDGQATGGTTTTNAVDGRVGKGERSHAGKAYLEGARARDNLTILTGACVKKVVLEHTDSSQDTLRATGVMLDQSGQPVLVKARREIVLCGGVFGSPQLLELSGIGNKDILTQAGIQCLLDLPGVGENLQDHLNFGPSVQVQSSIATLDALSSDVSVKEAAQAEYDGHRTGPLAEGAAYSYAYWPLQLLDTPIERAALQASINDAAAGSTALQRAQFAFSRKMLLDDKEASATVLMAPMRRYRQPGNDTTTGSYMTLVAMLSHPLSRGSSHVAGPDADAHPVIDLNYLSHPLDMEVLARHVVQTERLLQTPALSAVLEPNGERYPDGIGAEERSREDLERMIRTYSLTNYHPCGTCAMASADLDVVLDGELLVRGVENLSVCDASIFPIIPRGNILTTVYAVAEKGAELIRNRCRLGQQL